MLIVADENIPCVAQVLSRLGEVRTCSGRHMTADVVREAELLFVRSVTKVDAELLDDSRVRFVATATIGTDHVDIEYLRSRGIAFAAAPGSNAQSVAEYVAAALLTVEARGILELSDSTLGIVGVGNVGRRVESVASALGMDILRNDPPRERVEGCGEFMPLDEIARRADVVTFHVPLERSGRDPTRHMIDRAFLAKLQPGTVLINTSRGAVHDTPALAEARREGNLAALVLDVWEDEPAIDADLVGLADVATPHVAGYSFDGKVAGARMIYEAACDFLDCEKAWPKELPPREDLAVELSQPCVGDAVRAAVRAAYDIETDDARLREVVRSSSPAAGFDRMRREYPRRREFAAWRVALSGEAAVAGLQLERLGFRVE